jgi:chromosome segregation ATPase
MKVLRCVICVCVVIPFLAGCNTKELERVKAENDSLRKVLDARYSAVMIMRDIKSLIDSIDVSRDALHANLHEGTTYEDFTVRMRAINKYVAQTEGKIDTIERELKESRSDASAYMMMVAALKDELTIRADEVETLEKQVEDFKAENKGLINTIKLQENELVDMRSKIQTKQQDLNLLEAKVVEMVEHFKMTEAEAYFARAQAVEEAANRTKLAPNKKKETYREALELYKKSLSLGKAEAKSNIANLQRRLN